MTTAELQAEHAEVSRVIAELEAELAEMDVRHALRHRVLDAIRQLRKRRIAVNVEEFSNR